MGKITEISYTRTINLGNYESVRVGGTADVDEGEDADVILEMLKDWAYGRLKLETEFPKR